MKGLAGTKRFLIAIGRFVLPIAVVILVINGCFGGGGTPGVKITRIHKKALEQTITVAGSLIATNPVDVYPQVSGSVEQVYVYDGAEVSAGQALVKLDTSDLEQTLLSAEASRETAQNLASLSNSISSSTQSTAEAIASMQASVDQATQGVDILATLMLPFLTPEQQQQLEEQLEEYNRQAEENRAQNQVSIPQAAGTSSSAQDAASDKAIENAQRNLNNATICAPVDGTLLPYTGAGLSFESLMATAMGSLTGMTAGMDLTQISGMATALPTMSMPTTGAIVAGSYVAPGQPIYTVADLHYMTVSAKVDEADIGKVLVGQNAEVKLDAYPDQDLFGHVVRIANVATTNEAGATAFEVSIEMDAAPFPLKLGLNAIADVVVMSKPSALAVPLESVMEKKDKKYVFKVVDEKAKLTQVKVGFSTENEYEIIEGLKSGDRVITKGVEKVKDGQQI